MRRLGAGVAIARIRHPTVGTIRPDEASALVVYVPGGRPTGRQFQSVGVGRGKAQPSSAAAGQLASYAGQSFSAPSACAGVRKRKGDQQSGDGKESRDLAFARDRLWDHRVHYHRQQRARCYSFHGGEDCDGSTA